MTTRFYIDGLNLYYGALKGTSDKWLYLEAFADRLTPRDQIDSVKYFTARVSTATPAIERGSGSRSTCERSGRCRRSSSISATSVPRSPRAV
jgi:hypothetical protein